MLRRQVCADCGAPSSDLAITFEDPVQHCSACSSLTTVHRCCVIVIVQEEEREMELARAEPEMEVDW